MMSTQYVSVPFLSSPVRIPRIPVLILTQSDAEVGLVDTQAPERSVQGASAGGGVVVVGGRVVVGVVITLTSTGMKILLEYTVPSMVFLASHLID